MLRLSKVIRPWSEAAALNDHINLYGFWDDDAFLTKSGDLGMVLAVRQLIRDELNRADGLQIVDPILVEVTGLRLMLTNLLKPIALGQRLTPELFDAILTEVRRSKREVATQILAEMER